MQAAKKVVKKQIKQTLSTALSIQPIVYAFGSAALAIVLVVGAAGADVYRMLH